MTLDPLKQSAFDIVKQQLSDWDLSALAPDAYNLILQGYGTDAITLQLQQTDAYKARFSANDARIAKGLAALSPADYVAAENSYRQVLTRYGLPQSFYDSKDDFSTFIANDVSPSEVNQRAQAAQQVWLSTDTATRTAWTQFYGLTDGAAIASILDPKTALPIVQRMATASQIGGAALSNGLSANQGTAEHLADLGVTQAQAVKGFGDIGQQLPAYQQAASRFGTSFSQTEAEGATFLNDSAAATKQAQIADAEKGLFGARGSADQNTNATRASGSY